LISWRGGAAGAVIATALGLLLSVTAPASPPSLALTATNAVIGETIQATAELSEGPTASGEISFEVFGSDDPTCSGTALEQTSATVAGEGEYASGEFTPPSAGNYYWSAHYSGDGENEPADADCSATSTVGKATPEPTGSASSAVVGNAIHDEVTLTGSFSAGGEVTFSVYGPADTTCSTPLETTTAPLAGDSAASPDFISQEAGEYRWKASYPGDANNEATSLDCEAPNQTSSVSKASPSLAGTATSAVTVGETITDEVTLSGGFQPGGELVFRAFGPDDGTCASAPAYEATATVSGNGPYSPAGFAPGPGVYRWTVDYAGDGSNGAVGLACGAPEQSSAVGTIAVMLAASASGGTVGDPIGATAILQGGAVPSGQITFRAFSPGDANCSGTPAFTSVVKVVGNGSYGSAPFAATRAGSFRWTVAYSGDPNHSAATAECGKATSKVAQARPSIAGEVPQQTTVGTSFRDTATLQGGYAPTGTITFRIYGPVQGGCAKPAFVDTVAVNRNGTFSSDPFVALRTGRYSFVASYSGDAANQGASESCDSIGQVILVRKRAPKVKPRARLLGERQISIRARLSGGISPSGAITFHLYGPDDKRCRRKPAFSGSVTVKSNGTFSLARYIATRKGVYRLSVDYSGDQRNRRFKGDCSGAQPIRVS